MLLALVQLLFWARLNSEFPLTALYGADGGGLVCRPVEVCALFALTANLHFSTLPTLSFLFICYLH